MIDGSAWIGLSAYVFRRTRVPPLPPIPGRLGTLPEVTVEIPTVDARNRRGVAYRTVEAQHLPAVLVARVGLGVPYRPARVDSRRRGDVLAYRAARPGSGGLTLALRVRVADTVADAAVTPVHRALVNRAGIHAVRFGTGPSWWVRSHEPLTVRPAVIEELGGALPDLVGTPGLFDAAPDSVLVAEPRDVTYSWGGRA